MKNQRATQIALATLAVLVASDLADIVWRLHSGVRLPFYTLLFKAALLVPLALYARDYLRGFVITLIAFLTGDAIQRGIESAWPWFHAAPTIDRMYVDAWLACIPTLLIALTLVRGALTRRDIYLTRGELSARVAGLGPVRWPILAPLVIALLVGGVAMQLRLIMGTGTVSPHPPWSVMALFAVTFAAVNAFNEEFRFRFVLLAQGQRSIGRMPALLLTSIHFGLAHWMSGHPGGPTGFISTTLFAMLLCRSLYDTRGGLWAWTIHACSDVSIFITVMMISG